MSGLKIRLIQKKDIDIFVNLGLKGLLEFCDTEELKQSTINYHNKHFNKTVNFLTKIIDTKFHQFNKRAWVATDSSGDIIGTILVQPVARKPLNDRNGVDIANVYVDPEFRGTGISQRLLETAENHCIYYKIQNMYLTTQNNLTRAIKFYEKAGYVLTSQRCWQAYVLMRYKKQLHLPVKPSKKRKAVV
jgi:ribosomal protein S18 acetylase RimI-like enzyme